MDISAEYIKMCDWPEIQGQMPDFDSFDCEDQNFVANFHYAKACPTHGKEHLWTKANDEDFFCVVCGKELVEVDHISNIETYIEPGSYRNVWLPRQDQLQKMGFAKWNQQDIVANINTFSIWAKKHWIWGNSPDEVFISMEQLWLAFVMYELHGKKWDGNEWIVKSPETVSR